MEPPCQIARNGVALSLCLTLSTLGGKCSTRATHGTAQEAKRQMTLAQTEQAWRATLAKSTKDHYVISMTNLSGRPLTQTSKTEIPQGTIRVSAQAVELDATVLRAKDHLPIGGLKAGDFRLTEDGVPQTITYLSQNRLPLSIVVLFDLTDTVRPVLRQLAIGARGVLNHLRPSDEVAVMVFSSRTWLLQDFTTDREKVARAIGEASKMKSNEDTFLNEDLFEALQEAAKATIPHSRGVLLWLTDGTVNYPAWKGSKELWRSAPPKLHTEKEAINALLHSNVAVAALIERSPISDAALVAEHYFPPLLALGQVSPPGDIHKYASLTGGPVFSSDKRDATDRLADLLDGLRLRYTLAYSPSAPKPPGTFCRISLAESPQAKRQYGKLLIRTRRGYYR